VFAFQMRRVRTLKMTGGDDTPTFQSQSSGSEWS
jgi:hypothetical protein